MIVLRSCRGKVQFLSLFFFIVISVVLEGCAAGVGAGATVGVAAVQERGIKGRGQDLLIESMLLKEFIKTDIKLATELGIEVYEGRVLLTGETTNTELADMAVRLAWNIKGVKEVINEIQLDSTKTVTKFAYDTWITAQLKSKLTFDKNVLAINYSFETVNGIIYLIGVAQNQKELDRVLAHANNIKRVINVVNHVKLKKKPYEES